MYEQFYGLSERPFELTANPRFLFLTSGHREALGNLTYGLTAHKGITLLLGEAGTGKTTLVRAAIGQQRRLNTRIAYLSNPTLTRDEFFEFLAGEFELPAEALGSKVRFLKSLTTSVTQRRVGGGFSALVVDEAQSLPHELLEEVRLLSNLELPDEKLVPIVLAGQPELADRLNDPSLRQLKQRVALRCVLNPIDLKESAAYIAKRIRIAGGDSATIFTRDAAVAICQYSGGIPRSISVLCDNALVNGFALGRRPIDRDIVDEVARDFDLLTTPAPLAVPAESQASPLALVRKPALERATPAADREDDPPAVAVERDVFSSFTQKRKRFSFF